MGLVLKISFLVIVMRSVKKNVQQFNMKMQTFIEDTR